MFCVGWLKTGTTSFGAAMRELGFKHCGWDVDVWREWYKKGDIDRIIKYAAHFDSFDDLPWNKIDVIEKLDEVYPNSRFVLLDRAPEDWVESFAKHRTKSGAEKVNREQAIKDFAARNEHIRRYFSGAGDDKFLVMNIITGDGYETLCPFLGIPVLDKPFPHANRSSR